MYEILTKKYPATWWGLLRIFLWALFFLWVAGLAIPHHLEERAMFGNAIKDKSITPMVLYYSDRRIVREDVAFDPAAVNIAWICDSSCVTAAAGDKIDLPDAVYYKFIPQEVAHQLSSLYPSRKIHIYFYALFGPFMPDEEAEVSKALASRPDIVVFHVNTLRADDLFSLYTRPESKAELSKIWFETSGLRPLSFLLINPATNLYAAAGHYFRAIREMTHFKASLKDKVKSASTAAGKVSQSPDDPSTLLKSFWVTADADRSGPGTQKEWFIPTAPDPQSYVRAISGETIRSLAASGLPVLIYPTAIAPFYRKDAATASRLATAEKNLSLLKKRYENNHVVIIDHVPDSVIKKIVFKPQDPVHEEKEDAFVAYMTENIANMIKIYDKKGK